MSVAALVAMRRQDSIYCEFRTFDNQLWGGAIIVPSVQIQSCTEEGATGSTLVCFSSFRGFDENTVWGGVLWEGGDLINVFLCLWVLIINVRMGLNLSIRLFMGSLCGTLS